MGKDYEKLRQARFLYALYKTMREQIKEKPLDPHKIYMIKVEGSFITNLYNVVKKQFKDTRRLQKLGF